jgi:tRNA A37 methylthiotransferase MiaB
MNRQYTAGDFLDMIDRVRQVLDRPAITTDIVVGFPGETDEDFQATLDVALQSGFCRIHAFPFSPRPGTAAANWTDRFVDPATVKARMHRLAGVERETAGRYLQSFVGRTERVLVEASHRRERRQSSPDGLRHGRSDRYFEVFFHAPDVNAGDLVCVRINRVARNRVWGTLESRGTGFPAGQATG